MTQFVSQSHLTSFISLDFRESADMIVEAEAEDTTTHANKLGDGRGEHRRTCSRG